MQFKYYIAKLIKKIHLPAIKNSKVNKTSKICAGTNVVNLTLGRYSYIGNNCTVIYAEVGCFCSIADNCIIGGADHHVDWISTSPVFNKGHNILKTNFFEHNYNPYGVTFIGNDVWIGNNVLIKSGIRIGDGAVIGMGAVVTKDVGPYEIWAGNPARLIKKRFDEETIELLLKIKWWDLDEKIIYKQAKYFKEPQLFIKHIEGDVN